MYISNKKNEIETNRMDSASSGDFADPYDIDLVINYELHNHDNHTDQPMSGNGVGDTGYAPGGDIGGGKGGDIGGGGGRGGGGRGGGGGGGGGGGDCVVQATS